MNRYIILSLGMLLFTSCARRPVYTFRDCPITIKGQAHLHQMLTDTTMKKRYTVYKIDSVNNYYLIYAYSHSQCFKIVSQKSAHESMERDKKIEIGKTYRFKLRSLKDITPSLGGTSLYLANSSAFAHWHDKTAITIDGGSTTLYYPQNLQGLHLIKHNSIQTSPYGLIDWDQGMQPSNSTKD